MALLLALLLVCPDVRAQSGQRPAIMGIAGVSLQVSDMDKALAFYGKLLGFPHTSRQKDTATAKGPKIIDFRVNDRQSIRLSDGLSPGQEERLLEVAFQTTDAEGLRQYLQENGIDVPASVSREAENTFSFNLKDSEGNRIRFLQYFSPAPAAKIKPGRTGTPLSDRILHVGLQVRDQPAADRFYRDVLGFSEIWRGGRTDSVTSWINLRVPEGTDYLEYMLVPGKVSRQQLGVLHHLALLVPDIQKALDILRQRYPDGTRLPVPGIGRNNRWQLNLFDPEGTRVELMEPFTFR